MPQRPNILFVCTDQQSASAMSCAGNPYLQTPAMDRLASQGVRFDNAYCAFPLCGPSRASLMSGRMPREINALDNSSGIPADRVRESLGWLMQDAGYDCAYGGKWHVPTSTMPDDGQFGFRVIHPFGDDGLAESCAAYLAEPRGKPFFLVASFDNPHNICEWARNQPMPWTTLAPVTTNACPPLPANFADGPYVPQALAREKAANASVHPTEGVTPDWWRHYRHAYFRLVEYVDAQIGMILDSLDQRGLAENTVVMFTSDHGDGHGAHQWNQKTALWEESAGVPLIVRDGRAAGAARVSEALTCNGIDLLPTICDYAGAAMPTGLSGRSLRPVVAGEATSLHEAVVVETEFVAPSRPGLGGYEGTAGRMVRTARYKYCWHHWGQHREQLFDMQSDPGEMVNLAACDAHAHVLADHRQRLLDWSERHGDVVVRNCGFPANDRSGQ